MKSTLVCAMPAAALLLVGSWGTTRADTSEVKLPGPVVVAKSGKHCKDDPTASTDITTPSSPPPTCSPGSFSCSRRATRSIPI